MLDNNSKSIESEEKIYFLNPDLEVIKKGWKGNFQIKGRFVENASKPDSIWTTFKWIFRMNFSVKKIKSCAKVSKDLGKIPSEDYCIWLGHSSFLIRLDNKTIITDPIFYDLPLNPRLVKFSIDSSILQNIDYILISHNHPDHLNIKSLKELIKLNPKVKILAPMNSRKEFNNITENIEEASWFQKYRTDEIEVYFMPAYHWTKSNLFNANKSLWGSFIIKSSNKNLFFAGDTTLKNNFDEIRKFFAKIDYSFMPIAPSIYPKFHMTGKDALKVAKILRSNKIIPMHYGTYRQSLEDGNYSMDLFLNEAKKQKIIDKCLIPPMGKYFQI